ncbi:MAG: phosphoribosylamine--glycine ligase [Fimbriimonadaceae bacterium]|nr:phosphoribosylamine--glycine ligase [Fimbriimonadaceae bacterium]
MKILVIGGGGREHALCWKLAGEGHELFCAPGNPGIAEVAVCNQIKINDRKGLLDWAKEVQAELVVVGPEDPLISGMADMFRENDFLVFGPGQDAARLEGSKAFSKDMMKRAGVPTARHQVFSDPSAAKEFAAQLCASDEGVVIKASGAALGKGVVVCDDFEHAEIVIEEMLVGGSMGDAGRTVVIEERLRGKEFSLLTLVSGSQIQSLPVAQDYKRIGDGDTGLNTGGMGSYSPVNWVSDELVSQVEEEVVKPILTSMAELDIDYRGVLFSGLMLVGEHPYCLEYNVRFGDPEIQTIVLRLGGGFAEALLACAKGEVIPEISVLNNAACTVVVASGGYPGEYEKGNKISVKSIPESVTLFHAGTANSGSDLVTAGGRVIAVCGVGSDLESARERAYAGVDGISFAGKQFRSDVAK